MTDQELAEYRGKHPDGSGIVPVPPDADCAICAGEWHFYVMVDVFPAGEKGKAS